jgi:hypothetical protein
VDALGAVSMGARSKVIGNVTTHAALAVGASGTVDGNIEALAAVTFAAEAKVTNGISNANYGPLSSAATEALSALTDVRMAYDAVWDKPDAQDLDAAITEDVLLPGLYEQNGAWPPAGRKSITFDAQGDSDAVWIIRIRGPSEIDGEFLLVNGAKAANIQYVTSGAFALTSRSTFSGTVIANPLSSHLITLPPAPHFPKRAFIFCIRVVCNTS